jgi:hypothetical protein
MQVVVDRNSKCYNQQRVGVWEYIPGIFKVFKIHTQIARVPTLANIREW